MVLEQDFGKESIEERETGVVIEEVEASLEEVDAMKKDFSLFWKTIWKRIRSKLLSYHFGRKTD